MDLRGLICSLVGHLGQDDSPVEQLRWTSHGTRMYRRQDGSIGRLATQVNWCGRCGEASSHEAEVGFSEKFFTYLPLRERELLGRRLAPQYPTFLGCSRCGLPWSLAKQHSISSRYSGGSFCLCEMCWDELTPTDRFVYHNEARLKYHHEYTEQALRHAIFGTRCGVCQGTGGVPSETEAEKRRYPYKSCSKCLGTGKCETHDELVMGAMEGAR